MKSLSEIRVESFTMQEALETDVSIEDLESLINDPDWDCDDRWRAHAWLCKLLRMVGELQLQKESPDGK